MTIDSATQYCQGAPSISAFFAEMGGNTMPLFSCWINSVPAVSPFCVSLSAVTLPLFRLTCFLLLLAIATLSSLSQTAPGASTGAAAPNGGHYRIAGTVVNALTGEPVRRATVAILSIAESRTLRSVVSDEDGRFALEGLSAAKVQLISSKRGYGTAFYDQHGDYNSAIVTGEGQETENLIFRLTPQAILRGVITADGGDPVEGAKVMLFYKPRSHNPGDRIVQADSATTDDTGAYEFTNLTPGEFLLAVKAEPWYALRRSSDNSGVRSDGDPAAALDVAYPVTYFDSTTDEASASPITLSAGSRAEANIALHALPALHLLVQSGKQEESREQTELRQTVFGTEILALRPGLADDSKPIRWGEFSGLAPGHYELEQGDPPRLLDLDAAASQQIDPSAGTPAASISGTLQTASGSSSGSAAIDEITLTLNPLDGSSRQQPLRTTTLKGQFNFGSVPPGSWTLWAASSGKEWQIFSIAADGKTRSGNQLTVQDRALSLAVTVSDRATRIEGFARKTGVPGDGSLSSGWKTGVPGDGSLSSGWKDGKGLAGVMIVLVPQNPGANAGLFRRDQSDSDGSFALLDVIPGQYKIVAIEDGWELDWARPEVIARYLSQGVAVSIEGNTGKLIRLAQPVPVQPR
jgi:hypothetical protein